MIFFSSCIIACFYLFLIFLIFSFRFSPATLLSPLSSCSLTHFQNINSQQFSITIFFTLDNKHSRKCHFLFDIMSLLERIFECVYMMLIIDVQTPCIDCGVNVIALVTVFGGPRSRCYSPGCIIFFSGAVGLANTGHRIMDAVMRRMGWMVAVPFGMSMA